MVIQRLKFKFWSRPRGRENALAAARVNGR
jgi:hypothetical protein